MHRLGGNLEEVITPKLVRDVTLRYIRDHRRRRAVRRIERSLDAFVASLRADLVAGCYYPGHYHWKTIGGCGKKERVILIPPVRDAVAASVLVEVFHAFLGRRLYPHTYCNRRGFGGKLLACRLAAHLCKERPKYYVKFDIRKCFDSVRHEDVRAYIARWIKNRKLADVLLRLAIPRELSGGVGIPIGNGLSHHIANGILSPVWFAGRHMPGVMALYAYMDDVVMTSNNRRKLARAVKAVGDRLAALGFGFKYEPQVTPTTEGIDIVGYRLWPDGRRRLRRAIYRHAARAARTGNGRRAAAYLGFALVAHDRPLADVLRRAVITTKKRARKNEQHPHTHR